MVGKNKRGRRGRHTPSVVQKPVRNMTIHVKRRRKAPSITIGATRYSKLASLNRPLGCQIDDQSVGNCFDYRQTQKEAIPKFPDFFSHSLCFCSHFYYNKRHQRAKVETAVSKTQPVSWISRALPLFRARASTGFMYISSAQRPSQLFNRSFLNGIRQFYLQIIIVFVNFKSQSNVMEF